MEVTKRIVRLFCARLYRILWDAHWKCIRQEDIVHYQYNIDRDEFFLKCMRFIAFNQVKGDYLEFGCFSGVSFRFAYKYSKLEGLSMRLYAFDSFAGLPESKGIDVEPQWKAGCLHQTVEDFENILKSAGIRKSEYTLVPGYYSESLTEDTQEKLKIKKAALILVDCDLYESTVPVLNFILPYLQTGTIVALDDFYLFKGDPDRGEQRALREFLQQHPEIELVEYLNFGWHGKSYIVKKRDA